MRPLTNELFQSFGRMLERLDDWFTVEYQLWYNPERESIGYLTDVHTGVAQDAECQDFLEEMYAVFGRQRVGFALMEIRHFISEW